MKAIIYCRKSTDRWDRQQLSIESQEREALTIVKREWLEVVGVFKETQSAKAPWRVKFNEMMALISKWKADCIITWKLNRLARNPVDEWTIKWSIQNWIIKAIFTESETFKTWDNVLIMWMHFWMSTQYILDLQRDIKRGIKNKVKNWGVCQKAPLGYINNRLEKTVEVDSIKSKWVKEIFSLRSQNVSYPLITKRLYDNWITRANWSAFPKNTLEAIIKNKFYIWMPKINGVYYKWNYDTFISKRLFDSVQNIWQWISYRKETDDSYSLKGFLKDSNGFLLSWYKKKWHIYYKSSFRSEKVNINEKIIFNFFWEELSKLQMNHEFKKLNKEIIMEVLKNKETLGNESFKKIDYKIRKLVSQKEKLLDLRLEWEIDKEVYIEKSNFITESIKRLEEEKKWLNNGSLEKKIVIMFELLENLYWSYKRADNKSKAVILKNLVFELFVNSKKELSYADNSLLNCLICLQNVSKNQMEVPSGFEPLWTVLQTAV